MKGYIIRLVYLKMLLHSCFFFKVLVIFTDGELTSGNFSELEPHISDLSAQNVEIFSVAQGDDQVDEGLDKISKSKDYDHAFSLTPNAVNVPHVTKSLARAICNGTISSNFLNLALLISMPISMATINLFIPGL